jgi:AcrR family transcriptional regulator
MGGKAGTARKAPARRARRRREPGVQLGEDVVRNMILFGGSKVFAAHGFRAASVEHILEAANISRRTFYLMFRSKEDVAVALYRLGTESLVDACRRAVEAERDPLGQMLRCIDIHLRNARDVGRLIFVLGGEAQRPESPLYARRMEVQDAIVALLQPGLEAAAGGPVDPLLLRGLMLGLEAVTRMVLAQGDEGRRVDEASIERARRVMARVASATLTGQGPRVTPMPLTR